MNARMYAGAVMGLLGGLSVTLQGCGPSREQKPDPGAIAQIVPVETAAVERTPLSVTKLYSGSLEGEEQANIVARISERITEIRVRVGDWTEAGKLMVGLDKGGTSSQYYQAQANFRNAEKTLERMKALYAEGAVALQVLDGAHTGYDVAKANFDAARSAVELTTPIAGAVTAVNVSLGDLTTPGAVLVTVANIRRMKVTFDMNEVDVANVALGRTVSVSSEVKPDTRPQGKIIQLARSADVRSRSFEIKALFPNTPDRWFRPGMFVKVDLEVSPPGLPLVVPNAAIQSDGLVNRVFCIRGGRAFQVPVVIGVTDGERTVVLQGLAEHDTVATVGLNNLRDSSYVNVVSR